MNDIEQRTRQLVERSRNGTAWDKQSLVSRAKSSLIHLLDVWESAPNATDTLAFEPEATLALPHYLQELDTVLRLLSRCASMAEELGTANQALLKELEMLGQDAIEEARAIRFDAYGELEQLARGIVSSEEICKQAYYQLWLANDMGDKASRKLEHRQLASKYLDKFSESQCKAFAEANNISLDDSRIKDDLAKYFKRLSADWVIKPERRPKVR